MCLQQPSLSSIVSSGKTPRTDSTDRTSSNIPSWPRLAKSPSDIFNVPIKLTQFTRKNKDQSCWPRKKKGKRSLFEPVVDLSKVTFDELIWVSEDVVEVGLCAVDALTFSPG